MYSSFAIMPLSLAYLTQENYGIWLTISSIVGWTALFDLGLGNGLRNKLSESLAKGDLITAQRLTSTAYYFLTLVVIGLITLYSIIASQLDWNEVIKVTDKSTNISLLIHSCFILFAVRLVFDLINAILQAYQKSSYSNWISCLSNIIVLISVYALTKLQIVFKGSELFTLGLLVTIIPVAVLLLFNFYVFAYKHKNLIPLPALFGKKYIQDIWSLGWKFFLIQIAGLIIFSTDNILIAWLFNPSQVTIYNIVFRLFSVFTLFWGIIIAPFWIAFNEAYTKNDFNWIRKTMRQLFLLWGILTILILFSLPFTDLIFKTWFNNKIEVPFRLSLCMAILAALTSYCSLVAFFVNGIGKIKIQLITSVIAAIINIPLSVFFVKYLNTSTEGVIMATCVSLLPGAVFCTIQYKKVINKTATSIWNQ